MRLSDAIALGRTLGAETSPFTYCGCALSIGLRGAGKDKTLRAVLHDDKAAYGKASDEWQSAEFREWPWLTEVRDIPIWVKKQYSDVDVTCAYAYLIISDIFMMVTYRTATLDQLIDWVRSVEPAEILEVAHAEVANGDRAEVNT